MISVNGNLSPAIIVDLDECLALLNGRNPYDASTCNEDLLNKPVADMVRSYQQANPDYHTLILTGRLSTHRDRTAQWLDTHGIQWTHLFMREEADWTSAAFFKWAIYKRDIAKRYKIHAAFDDHPTVCRMFAEEGIPTYRVGNHHPNFKD